MDHEAYLRANIAAALLDIMCHRACDRTGGEGDEGKLDHLGDDAVDFEVCLDTELEVG